MYYRFEYLLFQVILNSIEHKKIILLFGYETYKYLQLKRKYFYKSEKKEKIRRR